MASRPASAKAHPIKETFRPFAEPARDAHIIELAPVERRTLNERAYERLKEALMSGRFLPGQILTLRALAVSLGTSVMPVRDAVGRLAAEQALELLPNRRILVPLLTSERSNEVWELRFLLEGRAAALAARHVTAPELEAISKLRDEVRAAAGRGDLHACLDRNHFLQFSVYHSARSPVLLRLIESLRMQTAPECTEPIRRILVEHPPFYEESLGYHDQLLESLRRRDATGAQRIRRRDLRTLRDWVRRCTAKPG